MVHFRNWFMVFFFLHCFYSIKSQFFQSRRKFETEKQRFPVNDFNRLRGTPFRFLFCIQDYLKAWLALFATFSLECSILGMPLRFSQIAFRPIVTLYQFSLGQHYRYGSSLLSTSQHLTKRLVAWNCALRLVHFHL